MLCKGKEEDKIKIDKNLFELHKNMNHIKNMLYNLTEKLINLKTP